MFKVKATYDYSSPHEDDLSFKLGQIITVTEEVDADWCIGEYLDDSGARHDGMFPRNFVQKYEPEPPPRPNRASRYKPLDQQPVAHAPPPQPEVHHEEPEPEPEPEPAPVQQQQQQQHYEEPEPEPQPPKPQAPPVQVMPSAKPTDTPLSPASPPSATSTKSAELPPAPAESAKPPPAAKKAPPPVAAKSNAFRDRIAAFNAPAAAPIQPFKPGGGAPATFIKKPFVAPPPSRNAYVPPPKEAPQVKTYRREEDPEIAERQAQDEEAADRAGLVAHGAGNPQEGEEDSQPKLSLKERIALLQKQQQEQAERAAAAHKEKPKRPSVKKRTESHEGHVDDSEDAGLEKVASGGSRHRESIDQARPPRTSHDIRSPDSLHNRDLVSENDADQSGAGDTEDAGGESTSVEDDEERSKHRQPSLPIRAAAAPAHEQDVGDEQDEEEEEEEEDEIDAETRRKMELRERMAKMSGGMGMGNMFNPMGMAPLPPKKKKPAEKKPEEPEEHHMPQQRVALFPVPGMPSAKSPEHEEDRRLAVEKEDDEQHPITGTHRADEVPDVEDVTPQQIQRTPTGERPPPIPTDKRPVPPPVPSASRPVPPPIPNIASPGPGSESGDELTDAGAHTMSPRSPTAPAPPPPKRSSYFGGAEDHAYEHNDRRMSSFPLASPTSPSAGRPPPPPPPTQAPPSRHADAPPKKVDRTEGETDYEGDYDTDIAPGATHKDALRSHTKDDSMDDSTAIDEPHSARSPTTPHGAPPLPPSAPRAVPPLPPPQPPNRQSMDAPRAPPPVPPVPPPTRNVQDDDDNEYDPYRYNSGSSIPMPAQRTVPPPPQSQPPPPQSRPPPPMPPSMPPVPQHHAAESSDDDDLYSAPPPRTSHDRPPPPPPQAPPHHHAPPPPPPPQERAAPPVPPQERQAPPPPPPPQPAYDPQPRSSMGGRKSLDASRALAGRSSTEQQRPASQGFIANDIDLGTSSHWWTQPRMLPPSLQSRKDVLVDMREAQSGSMVEKTVSVLYMDYSQTTISVRFEANNVSDVHFDQDHSPPPPKQRPDQLENAYEQFGRQIAKAAESKQNSVVGNGTPHSLIEELLKPHADALPPVSTRAFGALVYANVANASTQSFDEIRPGDIISFRNAKFQGKTGPMHAKYSMDVGKPDHVGVVVEWDGSKKKVRVWEQGREHKKVKPESFKMGDLRSGEVRVWRVMSRGWVGWN